MKQIKTYNMKGTLKKTTAGWFVLYQVSKNVFESVYDSIPLHPFDVKQIEEDGKVFDNIEARINAYPDVEFEIVMDEPAMMYSLTPYAKLIFSKVLKHKDSRNKKITYVSLISTCILVSLCLILFTIGLFYLNDNQIYIVIFELLLIMTVSSLCILFISWLILELNGDSL